MSLCYNGPDFVFNVPYANRKSRMKRNRPNPTTRPPEAASPTEMRQSLARALTFHASFDHSTDADFALGDKRLYSCALSAAEDLAAHQLGFSDPALAIVQGAGRFGAALAFQSPTDQIVLYKAERNVAYADSHFEGTLSFWLNLDPAEIPIQYSDPIQLTDKRYSEDAIWVDFTKNDTPSDFRMGVFGNRAVWDVTDRSGDALEFFWRLLKIEEPPFAKGQWTHVVITWAGLNTSQGGRARLYLDGDYYGASGLVREPFTWEPSRATIRLGMGQFVGLFDDLALFSRALTPDEINLLHGLKRGAVELQG